LVCGGSRGSGFGISRELAQEGAAVVLTGRQTDIVAEAVTAIRAGGGQAHGVTSPMTTQEGVVEMLAEAERVFGLPDILIVNTPGLPHAHSFAEATDGEF